MALWWHWFEGVQLLRAACARRRTFLWMVLVLAGLSIGRGARVGQLHYRQGSWRPGGHQTARMATAEQP